VLPAFRNAQNSALAALVSNDPAKLRKLGKKHGVENLYSYDEFEQCLAEGIDAVYITVPNHLHKEYAIRAANQGVHVLVEKPMAVTEADCKAMIDAAERNRVKLMVAYRLHFEKSTLRAIELATKGKLGELRFFSSEFGQQVDPENVRLTYSVNQGGGPVYDMGVYCINAARNFFRSEPIEVMAANASNGESRFRSAPEMTSVVLRFPEERFGSFTCSFGSADVSHYALIGTKGTLSADPAYDYSVPLKQTVTIGNRSSVRQFRRRDQFAPELIYFSHCILEHKEPEPSGQEGLADVRVIEAIHQSARQDYPVRLHPFQEKPRPGLHRHIAREKPTAVHAKSPSGEVA